MDTNNPTAPATLGQLTKNEHAARLIKQKYVLDLLYAINKDETAALASQYEPGEKADIKNDNGVKIGTVSMSNPNKKAVPDDDSILLGYAVEHGYEVLEMLPANDTKAASEIVKLVEEAGREDLLVPMVSKDDEDAIKAEVLKNWEFTGGSELPLGWEIKNASNPRFTVAKGRSAQAKAAFERETAPIREAMEHSAFREIEKGN
ncbi:hypothetical protein [Corynebacterium coyleae]|uniref:hypothetical protein n=1 Tax=Corynebacterium coyleae TaxID=53374 RepID=UPI00254F9AA0|nr:hypothetical protein [Corynebacterium coyleae]MDK8241664.1 hypothetical protein [Corynebacterium coyleae]